MTNDPHRYIRIPEDCPDDGDVYGGYYDCPGCGEPFDDDRWDHTHGGDARSGGSAWYVCPSCNEQSITVVY